MSSKMDKSVNKESENVNKNNNKNSNKNSKSKKNAKVSKEPTNLNELIIQEAVRQYKEGKIKSGMDVENFLDQLFQPLMQTMLDAELESHLERPKYEHSKDKKPRNMRNGYCSS